jgi:hypothetical protein
VSGGFRAGVRSISGIAAGASGRQVTASIPALRWIGLESREEWTSLAAELRDDRDAMLAARLPPYDMAVSNLAVREDAARSRPTHEFR